MNASISGESNHVSHEPNFAADGSLDEGAQRCRLSVIVAVTGCMLHTVACPVCQPSQHIVAIVSIERHRVPVGLKISS